MRKRAALHEFHRDVVRTILLADVIHRADVGMVQRGSGAGLALKALDGDFFAKQIGGKDLQGDVPAQLRVACAIHFAHAAGAKRRLNFIPAEFRARGEGHPCARL